MKFTLGLLALTATGVSASASARREEIGMQVWDCQPGEAKLDGEHCGSCPENAHFESDIASCVCNYGFTRDGGVCANPCADGLIWDGDCVCPPGETQFDGKHCGTCPEHAHFEDMLKSCACDFGYGISEDQESCIAFQIRKEAVVVRDTSSIHVKINAADILDLDEEDSEDGPLCPEGEVWFNGSCSCPAGKVRLDSIHCGSCPDHSHFEPGILSCVCNFGFETSGSICIAEKH